MKDKETKKIITEKLSVSEDESENDHEAQSKNKKEKWKHVTYSFCNTDFVL